MISAIIPAAGRSSRMGFKKAALPWERGSILDAIVDRIFDGGAQEIIIVVPLEGGPVEKIAERLRKTGSPVHRTIKIVRNPNPDSEMIDSVALGAATLDPASECFFLTPCDMPLIRPDTYRILAKMWRSGEYSILVPTYRGQRGHPPLIGTVNVPRIASLAGSRSTLQQLFEECAGDVLEVSVEDPGILVDLDTWDQYQLNKPR